MQHTTTGPDKAPLRGRKPGAGMDRQRGQALVEFTLILPLLVVLAVGILEFGMLFKDYMGIHYASREGARIGAAASKTTNADCSILRAISTTMSTMSYRDMIRVRIYKAETDGLCDPANCLEDVYNHIDNNQGSTCYEGWTLERQPATWLPIDRSNDNFTPDGIGVEVQYHHDFFFNYVPGAQQEGGITISDHTATQIEPALLRPLPR